MAEKIILEQLRAVSFAAVRVLVPQVTVDPVHIDVYAARETSKAPRKGVAMIIGAVAP